MTTRIAISFKSTDNPLQRAANLMELAQINQGHPQWLLQVQRELARGIAEYQAVDQEARR